MNKFFVGGAILLLGGIAWIGGVNYTKKSFTSIPEQYLQELNSRLAQLDIKVDKVSSENKGFSSDRVMYDIKNTSENNKSYGIIIFQNEYGFGKVSTKISLAKKLYNSISEEKEDQSDLKGFLDRFILSFNLFNDTAKGYFPLEKGSSEIEDTNYAWGEGVLEFNINKVSKILSNNSITFDFNGDIKLFKYEEKDGGSKSSIKDFSINGNENSFNSSVGLFAFSDKEFDLKQKGFNFAIDFYEKKDEDSVNIESLLSFDSFAMTYFDDVEEGENSSETKYVLENIDSKFRVDKLNTKYFKTECGMSESITLFNFLRCVNLLDRSKVNLYNKLFNSNSKITWQLSTLFNSSSIKVIASATFKEDVKEDEDIFDKANYVADIALSRKFVEKEANSIFGEQAKDYLLSFVDNNSTDQDLKFLLECSAELSCKINGKDM